MALLFIDGFDHYASADIGKKWTGVRGGYVDIESTTGRRGGGACHFSITNAYLTKTLAAPQTTLIVGFAYKSVGNDDRGIITLSDGSNAQIALTINSARNIVAKRGQYDGTTIGTSTNVLSTSSYQYIELKVVIGGGTTGSLSLRVNGVADTGLTLSGVNTSGAGTTVVSNVTLGSPVYTGTGTQGYYDDLYIANTSGTANNDFLGDCRIDTLFPNADGNYSQFTPSTGTSHFALVDEATPNTTDYNSSATVGNRDSYAFADLSSLSGSTIFGLQINAAALKTDAAARSLGTMSRLAGVDKDGAGAALAQTQTYISEIQETSPAGAAWTEANVNAAEFGVKVTA